MVKYKQLKRLGLLHLSMALTLPFTLPLALGAVLYSTPAAAQNLSDIVLPEGWTETKREANAITFTTPYSDGVAGYLDVPPEQAIHTLLGPMNIPANRMNVQSQDGFTVAMALQQDGKMISVVSRRADNGRTASILNLMRTPASDGMNALSQASIPLLRAMTESGGAPSRMASSPDEAASEPPARITQSYTGPLKPLAKAPPALIGYWRADGMRNEYRYPGGLTMVAITDDYVFTPGGYFISGSPRGVGFGDKGALATMADAPEQAGIFIVKPSHIELRYANGKTETLDYSKDGQAFNIQGGIAGVGYMGQKTIAPDGFKLNGVWVNNRISDTGVGFVSGASYIHFTASGQFLYSNSVSFAGAAMTSIQRDPSIGGTYSIADGAITLRYANGREEVMSLFWESSPDRAMWLNGAMYKPAA